MIPLAFCQLPPTDIDQLVAVVNQALSPDAPDDVGETVAEVAETSHRWAAGHRTGGQSASRAEIRCALALIQLHHGNDLRALARLHEQGPDHLSRVVEPGRERVTLTGPEATAYHRVVGRFLAAWRPHDSLARFLYEGR